MLTLPEEFLLLSFHESKGACCRAAFDRLNPGLVGAILAELVLTGNIQATQNHRLHVTDEGQVRDEILDQVISTLKETEKERKFGYWIGSLSQKGEKLQGKITENLIQKGVFSQDDERLVWVIPSPLKPEIKASTKYLVNTRLRGIVLAQETPETRDVVLLSLVRACGLLDLVFLRDERKLADRYIYELSINQAMANPVLQTVQEIEIAVAAAVEED
jgi:hypothetical protein